MKHPDAKTWISVTVLMQVSVWAMAQAVSPAEKIPPVTLENTELRILHSDIVGQDYEIFISLPASYHFESKVYPVIVGLDAFTGFNITKGCIDAFTSLYPMMPEVILVGIGYGGKGYDGLAQWIAGRTRDFTPVKNPSTEEFYKGFIDQKGTNQLQVHTGGAGQFLEFIDTELLPYLEQEYRIDKEDKALFGASFGGLFALFALFTSPGSFEKYFIESPSVHYRNGIIYTYEAEYADSHSDLDAEIFLCAGGLEKELIVNINKFDSIVQSRKYHHLHIEKAFFEGESHISCAPAAISRGLIELYNN
jgi:predicted alpha/beta superfamily hydrolase